MGHISFVMQESSLARGLLNLVYTNEAQKADS
jgi:hypothetical protein